MKINLIIYSELFYFNSLIKDLILQLSLLSIPVIKISQSYQYMLHLYFLLSSIVMADKESQVPLSYFLTNLKMIKETLEDAHILSEAVMLTKYGLSSTIRDENRDARLICFLVWFINHFYFYCRWKGRHPEKVIYQVDKFTAVKGQAKNHKVKFRHILQKHLRL